jgi:predicted deacylase
LKKTYTRKIDDLMPVELDFHVFGEGAPRVFFTGGIHGGEATGIYVVEKVLAFLEEHELLKGSVKVLPRSNPAAFRRLQRSSPYDELDLNRIFPGQDDSAPSLALAKLLWQEAQDADYIVDMHCCGVWGASYTLAVYNDYDYAKELAAMLAIPRVIESGGTKGQLFVEAGDSGIPAVIIELPGGGQGGVIDLDAAEECYQALLNMLRQLGMLAGEAVKPHPTFYGKLQPVMSKVVGPFLPQIKPGDAFKQGDVLGHVGETAIVAPITGVATMVRPACYVFKGTPLANVAPLV